MATIGVQMDLGEAYRKAAAAAGLIYDRDHKPAPGDTVFTFYVGANGDMATCSGPFALAELILLGRQFADNNGLGDHMIILSSYACMDDLTAGHSPMGSRYIHWDYEHEVRKPTINFEDWLVKQLSDKCMSKKQLSFRYKFIVALAEMKHKPLNFIQKFLWLLPF